MHQIGSLAFRYDHMLKLEEGDLPRKLEEIFRGAGVELPAGIEEEPRNQHRTDHGAPNATIADFYRDAAAEGGVTMEELIALVRGVYKDDIDLFGYSFPRY